MLNGFNAWLDAVFVGPRGYKVYADGRMERCVIGDVEPHGADPGNQNGGDQNNQTAFVTAKSFHQLFGYDADLNGSRFFIPGRLLPDGLTGDPLGLLAFGRQFGLMGEFRTLNGQTGAVAAFVWNRSGLRTSMLFIWMCLVGMLLDLIAGSIALSQNLLNLGDATVIALTLLALGGAMFLPRVLGVFSDKLFADLRHTVIAKLSALVQHEAQLEAQRGGQAGED